MEPNAADIAEHAAESARLKTLLESVKVHGSLIYSGPVIPSQK